MFSKKRLFTPVALILTSFLGASAANAQVGCYTVASLQGNYALVGTYGANVAKAIGTRSYDGNGNLSGVAIINEPTAGSTTGARTLVVAKQAGTYTVNCDGTGQFNRVVTTNTGITAIQVDDFVITGAVVLGGQLIATSIVDTQEVASAIVAGGIFLSRVQTRLPQPPPTAIAGPKNVTVTSREIQLDASQSTSADGKPLTYLWTIPQGSPLAAILGGTTATPTVQFAQRHATYAFQLTVTDSAGNSSTDLATVNYQGN
jgi:hypothetical protein